MVGDHVTLDVVEVVDNDGMWCVRCKYDGDYDKTGLPDPLIMTNYFRVNGDKIVTLFIVTTPSRSTSGLPQQVKVQEATAAGEARKTRRYR